MLDCKSLGLFVAGVLLTCAAPVGAQIVPGSGQELTELNDNFEDANWLFNLNLPKASTNIDKVDRQPAGYSANGMWFESTYRGTPDFVKRVETPPGGLPGSHGAMAMQTLYSGVPGKLSQKFQQDDLLANVSQKLGFMIPAAWTPSYVVRVYLPPFEAWEQRNGSSFGFRADCQTILEKPTRVGRFFRTGGMHKEMEQYWPGFFIQFNAKNHPQHLTQNSATILIRSGERGEDIPGPTITQTGWWTLGMTITPDGKVHYYGHPGVANLTHRDHLYSNFPYGYKCLQTSTYFFNIVNQDDGRTWSTRWIVDDPKVFVATRPYSPQTAQTKVPAQPVSQTRPATPESAPAATPVTTPAITQPAILAVPKPVAPTPAAAIPATQAPAVQTPPIPSPAVQSPASNLPPTATTTLDPKPVGGGIPTLQATATPIVAATLPKLNSVPSVRAKSSTTSNSSTTVSTSTLPPLLNVPTPVAPIPVTPTKAADSTPPQSPPALLPDESNNESAPLIAPVISAPVPAPMALPQDDAPMLPMTPPPADTAVPPLQPPAPPTAE
jgi:hypothetical protein